MAAMKVTCLQENLHKGLQTVGKAVANKTTLPVLNNILVSTDRGRLKLAATNLEVGITNWIGCQVEEEGAITVPARLLSDFVASLPNDRITMTLDERTLARHISNVRAAPWTLPTSWLMALQLAAYAGLSATVALGNAVTLSFST